MLENQRQERPSSGEPPVLVVSVAGAEDAAAKIPKIVHQMWAMTQFFSTWGLIRAEPLLHGNDLQRTHYEHNQFRLHPVLSLL